MSIAKTIGMLAHYKVQSISSFIMTIIKSASRCNCGPNYLNFLRRVMPITCICNLPMIPHVRFTSLHSSYKRNYLTHTCTYSLHVYQYSMQACMFIPHTVWWFSMTSSQVNPFCSICDAIPFIYFILVVAGSKLEVNLVKILCNSLNFWDSLCEH